MNPSILIVIPSFNRISYLINSLESVFNQTYDNFKVVVVNDGSTDPKYKSHKFLKNIKQIDLEENQKNLYGYGPGSIRNFGNIEPHTKYVAFLDDDDIWMPNKLEEQVNIIENSPEKMVCTDAYIGNGIFEENKEYQSYLWEYYLTKHKEVYFRNKYLVNFKKFHYPNVWDLAFLNNFRNLANPIITSTVLTERQLLDKVGWFRNLPFAADFDCWKAIMQFTNCKFINKPLVYYDNNHGDGRNYTK